MKKLFNLFLSLLFVFAFVSCSNILAESEKSSITIQIPTVSTSSRAVTEEMKADFNLCEFTITIATPEEKEVKSFTLKAGESKDVELVPGTYLVSGEANKEDETLFNAEAVEVSVVENKQTSVELIFHSADKKTVINTLFVNLIAFDKEENIQENILEKDEYANFITSKCYFETTVEGDDFKTQTIEKEIELSEIETIGKKEFLLAFIEDLPLGKKLTVSGALHVEFNLDEDGIKEKILREVGITEEQYESLIDSKADYITEVISSTVEGLKAELSDSTLNIPFGWQNITIKEGDNTVNLGDENTEELGAITINIANPGETSTIYEQIKNATFEISIYDSDSKQIDKTHIITYSDSLILYATPGSYTVTGIAKDSKGKEIATSTVPAKVEAFNDNKMSLEFEALLPNKGSLDYNDGSSSIFVTPDLLYKNIKISAKNKKTEQSIDPENISVQMYVNGNKVNGSKYISIEKDKNFVNVKINSKLGYSILEIIVKNDTYGSISSCNFNLIPDSIILDVSKDNFEDSLAEILNEFSLNEVYSNKIVNIYLKGEISKSEKTDETPSSQYNNQNNFYEKIGNIICVNENSFSNFKINLDMSKVSGSEIEEIPSYAFANLIDGNYSVPLCLNSMILPNGVKTIKGWAFAHFPLSTITIPSSVTTIESNAFDGSKLTKVVFEENSKLTSIESDAFSDCEIQNYGLLDNDYYKTSNDGKLLISKNNPMSSVDTLDTFLRPRKYEDGNDMQCLTIVAIASNIVSLDLKDTGVNKLTKHSISSSTLTTLSLDGVLEIDSEAIYNCPNLTDIDLGDDVEIIMNKAFYKAKCSKFILPKSLKAYVTDSFSDGNSYTKHNEGGGESGAYDLPTLKLADGFDTSNWYHLVVNDNNKNKGLDDLWLSYITDPTSFDSKNLNENVSSVNDTVELIKPIDSQSYQTYYFHQ